MIPAIFALFIIGFAFAEAYGDHVQIGTGVPIDHVRGWIFRAIVVGAGALFLVGTVCTLWQGVCLAFGGAFLFSGVFRYRLNELRGLHWNYISPSNLYDWAFLRPFMNPIDRTECVEAWHVYMASRSALNAGKATYITEAIIYAALTAAYFL